MKINIYVPQELRARMLACGTKHNWSAIAQIAIERVLESPDQNKTDSSLPLNPEHLKAFMIASAVAHVRARHGKPSTAEAEEAFDSHLGKLISFANFVMESLEK